MEGAAAETVKGLTADKDEDYDLIWENVSRRFRHISRVIGPVSAHKTGSRNRAKNIYFEYLIITKEYLLNTPKI